MNKNHLLYILNTIGVKYLNKKLGQNFLIDNNILKLINNLVFNNINNTNLIIEIGSGLGALTEYLLESIKNNNIKIISIEYDKQFVSFLKEKYKIYKNFIILEENILNFDFDSLTNKLISYKIVSNLPYSISTPIFNRILDCKNLPEEMFFLVQKEVANKISSMPNCKDYRRMSVKMQIYFTIKYIRTISSSVFYPKPKVSSAIIKCNKKNISITYKEKKIMDFILKVIFSNRRKKIKNSINYIFNKLLFDSSTEYIIYILDSLNIDPNYRPENINPEQYLSLTKYIANNNVCNI